MSTFVKQSHDWRRAALFLLLVAIFGAWSYEGVYNPPGIPCTWPNAQPEGHPYCGIALPIAWELVGLLPLTAGLLVGEGSLNQWAAQAALPLLLTLSLVTLGLLLVIRRDVHGLLFACTWVLAAIAGIGFVIRGYYQPYALPWGNLLFIAVALTALLLELFLLPKSPPRTTIL